MDVKKTKEILKNLPKPKTNTMVKAPHGSCMTNSITPTVFSVMFKEMVKALSLSDQDLAEMFSVSRPTANRWSNGTSAPALEMRRLVLNKLNELIKNG